MFEVNHEQTQILIIGGGIAGLRAAVAALENGCSVTVLSKGPRCSAGVIGFNAPVGQGDSSELYYQDILSSGKGLSQENLARMLAEKSAGQVEWLEKKGLVFDTKPDGSYDLLKPLGCSVPRLVHKLTLTGSEEEKIFLDEIRKCGGKLYNNAFALDLISDGETVYGAVAVIDNKIVAIESDAVVMAAGGCGGMYPVTVYPRGIAGDSYAMAARAGAEMIDMEFMQFEPCCLLKPDNLLGKGISTTLMNAGGRILNANEEEFLDRYFEDTSKIQKGELSRAIYNEAQLCGGPCLYDLRNVPEKEIIAHCLFYKQLMDANMNPKTTLLPIMPAAHTFLGGIKVDGHLKSNLKRLYAAGENLGGLHGANRIGGCAGAEIVTFGAIAGEEASKETALTDIEKNKADAALKCILEGYDSGIISCIAKADDLLNKLRNMTGNNLNLIRDEKGLNAAAAAAKELMAEAEKLHAGNPGELIKLTALKNMILTSYMIAETSLMRRESRGVFFRSDYPETNQEYCKNATITARGIE